MKDAFCQAKRPNLGVIYLGLCLTDIHVSDYFKNPIK